jgi:hypothetical protein
MIECLCRGWVRVRSVLDRTMRLFVAFIEFVIGAAILKVLLIGGFDLMTGRDSPEDAHWSMPMIGAGMFGLGSWICIACVRAGLLWLRRQFRIGTAVS